MRPILLDFTLPLIGQITFPAYFTMLTLGLVLAALITVREARKLDLDPQDILDINLYMTIWGVIGSRLLHVIADGHFMDYVNLCVDPTRVPAIDALAKTCNVARECGYDYLCDAARHICYPPRDCFAWAKLWRHPSGDSSATAAVPSGLARLFISAVYRSVLGYGMKSDRPTWNSLTPPRPGSHKVQGHGASPPSRGRPLSMSAMA